jgi:hypothetical protein
VSPVAKAGADTILWGGFGSSQTPSHRAGRADCVGFTLIKKMLTGPRRCFDELGSGGSAMGRKGLLGVTLLRQTIHHFTNRGG